jgi:hypothetical protein
MPKKPPPDRISLTITRANGRTSIMRRVVASPKALEDAEKLLALLSFGEPKDA